MWKPLGGCTLTVGPPSLSVDAFRGFAGLALPFPPVFVQQSTILRWCDDVSAVDRQSCLDHLWAAIDRHLVPDCCCVPLFAGGCAPPSGGRILCAAACWICASLAVGSGSVPCNAACLRWLAFLWSEQQWWHMSVDKECHSSSLVGLTLGCPFCSIGLRLAESCC